MSLLARYKKPGGMEKLIRLIETSSEKVAHNIMDTIEKEDPKFLAEVKKQIFTFNDILSQHERVLTRLLKDVPYKVWAFALHNKENEEIQKTIFYAERQIQHKIKDELEIIEHSCKEAQTITAQKKIIETARQLESDKEIQLHKDPSKSNPIETKNHTPKAKAPTDINPQANENKTRIIEKEPFITLSIESIKNGEISKSSLYMLRNSRFIKCKSKGEQFSASDLKKLQSLKISYLYIPVSEVTNYASILALLE